MEIDHNQETHPFEPICSCGHCIKKRLTISNFTKFPYSKNLRSMYNQDFDWKTTSSILPSIYNKSKFSGFDGVYKENMSTGLISTNKFDFKPFKIERKEDKKENFLVHSMPFFGRSTYNTMFPDWGLNSPSKKTSVESNNLNIPLRGYSNYAENYVKFPENCYKTEKPEIHRSQLEFSGKFSPDTTNRYDYKLINLRKNPAFTLEKFDKNAIEKSSLIPAPFPKANMHSTYNNDYIKLKKIKPCLLAEYNRMKSKTIENS